jgi:molybdenum-dependent DNA-binding transcriptional regulator ModE
MDNKGQRRAEVLSLVEEKAISSLVAAERLEISYRQAKRIYKSFKDFRVKGGVSKKTWTTQQS